MTNKTIIWVANEAGHSYEKALDIVPEADIKPLTLGNINPLNFDRLSYHIARGVTHFVKRDDYLLISGTPVVNAVAMHIWLLHFGRIKLLQWNAKRREYELTEKENDDFKNLIQRELERG